MVTLDGHYPPCFRRPRRLKDIVHMDSYHFDELMLAYDLGSRNRRYYDGSLASRRDADDYLYSIKEQRRRDLIALFEYLGAHRLVEPWYANTFPPMMDSIVPLSVALLAFAILLTTQLLRAFRLGQSSKGKSVPQNDEKDPYADIEPMPLDFDWSTTPPIKVWPFKSKYHLSLSTENITISNLLEMDSTYLDRIALRKEIMDKHPEATRQCNKLAEPAVLELYNWLVTTYLPLRFPTIHKLTTTVSGRQLHNTANNTYLPVEPASPMTALYTLGHNIDTDFLLLLPSSTAPDGSPIYHLEAYMTCFPAGFSTREKLGLPLAAIHAPVPGYAAKLERSMDRFFAKLEVGRVVKRANWSVSTDGVLFSEAGNHMYGDDGNLAPSSNVEAVREEIIEKEKEAVVVEECRVRCERQTLHRLPRTRALVFAFKTYLYSLEEVKAEGLGGELAEAIEGLKGGSVPEIAVYKRGVVWGEKVREFLLAS
ncbi:hypothetical protein LTR62_004055 [Meristemomyces frigidus]|uniref:Uncharacterized protein n=1 Tax=Meristemomyces frigidus TaxID=1508187 RepID=A0AAN7YJK1_9PEZI|nr:hypothetical protein LTR62_004055 [Meristemomyces frigidus]